MDEREVWLRFAAAAVEGFEPDDSVKTLDDLAEDVEEVACEIADAMTDAFAERFGFDTPEGEAAPRRRERRRGTKKEKP